MSKFYIVSRVLSTTVLLPFFLQKIWNYDQPVSFMTSKWGAVKQSSLYECFQIWFKALSYDYWQPLGNFARGTSQIIGSCDHVTASASVLILCVCQASPRLLFYQQVLKWNGLSNQLRYVHMWQKVLVQVKPRTENWKCWQWSYIHDASTFFCGNQCWRKRGLITGKFLSSCAINQHKPPWLGYSGRNIAVLGCIFVV